MSQENTQPRRSIHLTNECPHIYEIEDMMEFCQKQEHIYIYGAAENQEYLMRFLDICGISADGYVVTQPADACLQYRKMPVITADELLSRRDAGVILGLADRHYRFIIPKFRRVGFTNYFIPSEYNKRTIASQLKPRPIEEMMFEVNLADHCNISCQMCDHYSQLSEKHFIDLAAFEKDMERMGKLFAGEIACVTLLGGEPTLHKDLIRCMEIARGNFPRAQIIILTNGLLLPALEHAPQGNLWQACRDLNIHITVTVYPLKFDYEALERKAAEYGVALAMSSNIHAEKLTREVKMTDKHTLDLSGSVGKHYSIACVYFNKFSVLKDGRFYMCPPAAHSGIFNKYFGRNLELTEKDSLDIYEAKDWRELAEFTARPVPFCRYCDVKNWRRHSQWKASSKEITEYI